MICNTTVRLQVNAQVQEGGSTHRSSSSCDTVHEGELDELGPISTKFISRGLQGCTRLGL
jgi:hypothetical protein